MQPRARVVWAALLLAILIVGVVDRAQLAPDTSVDTRPSVTAEALAQATAQQASATAFAAQLGSLATQSTNDQATFVARTEATTTADRTSAQATFTALARR